MKSGNSTGNLTASDELTNILAAARCSPATSCTSGHLRRPSCSNGSDRLSGCHRKDMILSSSSSGTFKTNISVDTLNTVQNVVQNRCCPKFQIQSNPHEIT